MNRIQRITAAAAIGAAVFAPATAAVASARPDPGQAPQTSNISTTKAQIEHDERLQMLDQRSETTKAQIEHDERLQMLDQRSDAVDGQSASSTGADTAGFPWETVGLAALAGAAIAAGGVAVVRRLNNEPSRA